MQLLRPWKHGIMGATVWVPRLQSMSKISILLIIAMCCISSRVCPNLPWYSIPDLQRKIPGEVSASMSYFAYVNYTQNVLQTFLNFSVGNRSCNRFVMRPVWSILKPIRDWQIQKFRYLRTDNFRTFISKAYSNAHLSSVNAISILLVFIISLVETLR